MHSWSTRPGATALHTTLWLLLLMSMAPASLAETRGQSLLTSELMHQKVHIVEVQINGTMYRDANEDTARKVIICFRNRAYSCEPSGYVPNPDEKGLMPVYDSATVDDKMIWSFYDCFSENIDALKREMSHSAGTKVEVDTSKKESPSRAPDSSSSTSRMTVRERARDQLVLYRRLPMRQSRARLIRALAAQRNSAAMSAAVVRRQRYLRMSLFCDTNMCCAYSMVGADDHCLDVLCGGLGRRKKELCG